METRTDSQLTAAQTRRLYEVWSRTVEALQDVVRELKITEDELHAAAHFFNRTGQAGVFPSLVDVSLAVTSIEAKTATTRVRTRANVEGPFYRPGAPLREDGNLCEHLPSPDADELVMTGRIIDSDTGKPIAHAVLDVWQADEHGSYDGVGFHLRGRVHTAEDGAYHIRCVVPADYEQHRDDPIGELYRLLGRHSFRPAHIHLKVWVDDELLLTTQLFMPDSPVLDTDYVIGAVAPDLVIEKRLIGETGGRRRYSAEFDLFVSRRAA
jgi:protocatechuate 3,4-dioxygenase beta subunit